MADIKQAAKWMQEGKTVTRMGEYRLGYFPALHFSANGINDENGEEIVCCLSDLLANDWELSAEPEGVQKS